jgi:hypothetical protein
VQFDHSPSRGVDAVQDGGFLDLRSIYMIRGGGYDLDDGAASHIIHAISNRLVLAKMSPLLLISFIRALSCKIQIYMH